MTAWAWPGRAFCFYGSAPGREDYSWTARAPLVRWTGTATSQGSPVPVELSHPEHFVHVRIIIGMVLGISLSRLIVGLSEFIQHPKRKKIYPIHLGWVLYLFLTIIHFWWYEFSLAKVRVWSFELYFFLIFFTSVFALMASLLFPPSMEEYRDFEDYFQARRR